MREQSGNDIEREKGKVRKWELRICLIAFESKSQWSQAKLKQSNEKNGQKVLIYIQTPSTQRWRRAEDVPAIKLQCNDDIEMFNMCVCGWAGGCACSCAKNIKITKAISSSSSKNILLVKIRIIFGFKKMSI